MICRYIRRNKLNYLCDFGMKWNGAFNIHSLSLSCLQGVIQQQSMICKIMSHPLFEELENLSRISRHTFGFIRIGSRTKSDEAKRCARFLSRNFKSCPISLETHQMQCDMRDPIKYESIYIKKNEENTKFSVFVECDLNPWSCLSRRNVQVSILCKKCV